MHFYHPRYWLIWILYGFLRLISYFPYRSQVYLGRKIGSFLRVISRKRRLIAKKNLQLCFSEWTEEEREAILRRHFESLGISLFEFGISWWWSDKRMQSIAQIEGLENLQDALKKNRGVILLAAHFTTLEIISRVLKLHADFHPMYRKNNNPLIDAIIKNGREKHCGKVIPHDSLRSMIRSLRSNTPVLYIPDQNFGRKHSIFVPFFGIQTASVTATSRLAGIDNTPVIPIIQQRLVNDEGYRLVISEALENFPSDSIEQDTIRLNKIIEDQVRQFPAEYLWVHRRFKTRPEGEASFYDF